jgi:hypothetical protein
MDRRRDNNCRIPSILNAVRNKILIKHTESLLQLLLSFNSYSVTSELMVCMKRESFALQAHKIECK